jgi:hypothetical protein
MTAVQDALVASEVEHVATVLPDGASGGSPTVLRIMLGGQLRQLREFRGISRETAGFEIRASESKISRMELGRVGFKERDVADLLTLYGVVDEAERAAVLALVRRANLRVGGTGTVTYCPAGSSRTWAWRRQPR